MDNLESRAEQWREKNRWFNASNVGLAEFARAELLKAAEIAEANAAWHEREAAKFNGITGTEDERSRRGMLLARREVLVVTASAIRKLAE